MPSGSYGVNIMTIGRIFGIGLAVVILAMFSGCGSKTDSSGKTSVTGGDQQKSDRDLIQERLTETITRWHYGDKAALYDNEPDYLWDKYTFDDYLKMRQIEWAEADTVIALNVTNIKFYGRDSALANVEVVFKGPTGVISKDYDKYMMYYYRGGWNRPTVGTMDQEMDYENVRRQADSAAEAEARESGKG